MPKKNNAAPNGAAQPETLEGAALAEMSARYEAAKQFMIEAELSAAALRKALRAAVLELRRGDGATFTEIADRLEEALHARHTPSTSDARLEAATDQLKATDEAAK